ncbi:MAG: efflux RND transporter permease subunit [Planctomycetes bacterium]|nr:efflux RND transporter permease subunit [Planctomycetota bacterium]
MSPHRAMARLLPARGFLIACAGILPTEMQDEVLTLRVAKSSSSAEAAETAIAAPLEQALSGVPGVASFETTCTREGCSARVQLRAGADLADVRARLVEQLREMPCELLPPRVDARTLLVVASPRESDLLTHSRRSDEVRGRIARIEGVSAVEVEGASSSFVAIEIDDERLHARSATRLDVARALDGAFAGDFEALERVRVRAEVELRDVAIVHIDTTPQRAVLVDGLPSVLLHVQVGERGDLTAIERAIDAELPSDMRRLARAPVRAVLEAPAPTSLEDAAALAEEASALLRSLEELTPAETVLWRMARAATHERGAQVEIGLSKAWTSEVLESRRAALRSKHPRCSLRIEPSDAARFSVDLLGRDLAQAANAARELRARLDALASVDASRVVGADQEALWSPNIDRDALTKHALSPSDLESFLDLCRAPARVARLRAERTLDVFLMPPPPDALGRLELRNARGELVSLAAVCAIDHGAAPASILRRNGERLVRLEVRSRPGAKRAEARAELERAIAAIELPAGLRVEIRDQER